jgi:valyl-tRNA synthetase
MKELSKQYNPQDSEKGAYKLWEEKGMFVARVCPDKKPYTIIMPPPNITGVLHMGHALNNTIQDILIRYKRMKGYESLWMPGTDHAGIATQNVVERRLVKEGKKRRDIGRDSFIDEVWRWREEYGGSIIKQLKRIGASCDWRRERFTMDEGLSDAVLEAFIRLYKKGLIYRGDYIINWCPRCQTALSDEEAEHREIDGNLYYIRYPLKPIVGAREPRTEYVTVATTRPETILGDTGLAVNPGDGRYKALIGETAILPVLNREIKIIADDIVDPAFGTGVVKVTPAHDVNDFQIGKRHGLAEINIMRPDGVLNENAGEFEGMDRFQARESLIKLLKEKKLLEKIIPHKHAVGHCYRCHTIVEPYLSRQWFVRMKPLAGPAIEAVETERIRFYPRRWKKVYLNWMYNIRDWCISRQIWWGHRLPVYYCRRCSSCDEGQVGSEGKGIIVSKTRPDQCPDCGSTDIIQDEDVLDTWFSSWLWPFSTLGWPFDTARGYDTGPEKDRHRQYEEFKYFYPTACLVTAQEIIFFWVARMIMAGIEFCGDIPFRDVYIHGTVRDDTGTKMSKSLGNTIDPIEIIDRYGADALRFSIISITAAGQDIFLSKERFEAGRNFANKLWNVARFLLMNLKDAPDRYLDTSLEETEPCLADNWVLGSFYQAVDMVEKALAGYRFNDAANIIYDFIWHKYCDWYVEIAKADMQRENTRATLFNVLLGSLRMLHPFMPFVTEAIWQQIGMRDSIMASVWPRYKQGRADKRLVGSMDKIIGIIVSIRNIRAEMSIANKREIQAIISTRDEDIIGAREELELYLRQLAGVSSISIQKKQHKPRLSASSVMDFCGIFIPLEGVIDIDKERSRLDKDLAAAERFLSDIQERLRDKSFIDKAPEGIVQGQRQKALTQEDKIARIKENIKALT